MSMLSVALLDHVITITNAYNPSSDSLPKSISPPNEPLSKLSPCEEYWLIQPIVEVIFTFVCERHPCKYSMLPLGVAAC